MTITRARAGRVSAILLGLQGAKGTPVSDFTIGLAARIWTNEGNVDPAPKKSDPAGWMSSPQLEAGARYNVEKDRKGEITVKATPTALELLLRSNWGPFSANAFALEAQASEWLSLGLVENVMSGSTEFFYRIHDVLFHRLTFSASVYVPLTVRAEYAGEVETAPQQLDSLAGITLPAPLMPAGDKNVFPGRLVKVVRDPDGVNETIETAEFELSIDQRLGETWDQLNGVVSVFKAGFPGPQVRIRITGHVSDETWRILSASRAGTKQDFRITAIAQAPQKTLQIDLHGVDFVVDPIGHVGQKYVQFAGVGQAHLTSGGDFVTITMS